jgi:hypothetical protein
VGYPAEETAMTTSPEEPQQEPMPDEESPEEPGIGAQDRPVSEPDVEGDPDLVGPNPVEDA